MVRNKCVIFSGGPLEVNAFHKSIAVEAGYIICADGGARHAKALGIIPNLVLGDFDTLTPAEIDGFRHDGVEIIRYPREKDYTDTHLAVLKALQLGFFEIDILAALGGRLDHTLANIMLLAMPEARKARIKIVDEKQEIFLVEKQTTLEGKKGDTVSLLPLCERVTGIATEGLSYQVPDGIFNMGIPIGVSNLMDSEKAVIEVEKGLLLVIRVKENT